MRLYELVARYGKYRGSLLPWFDDPLAVRPEDWAGWHWDMGLMKWVEIALPEVTSHYTRQRLPKPDKVPRPFQNVIVEGWSWNGRTNRWEEVPMPKKLLLSVPGAPAEVLGWQWSDSQQEWISILITTGHYEDQPRPPKPTWIPEEAQKYWAEGWYWSVGEAGWVKDWSWVPDKTFIPDPRPPMPEYVPGPTRPPMPETGPSRGEAWEVPGWTWSLWEGMWVEAPMPYIEVEVPQERGPKPEYPPGFTVPDTAKDWFWDYGIEQWSPTTIYAEAITFTPPGSLPPYAVDEAGLMPGPYEHEWRAFLEGMLRRGFTVGEAQRVSDSMRLYYQQLARPQKVVYFAEMWDGFVESMAGKIGDQIQKVGSAGALIGLVALVGFLLGLVAARIVEPEEELARLYPDLGTYLIGPDDWTYASNVGVSLRGEPYFRACDSIGSTNDQHLRGEPWQTDRIAFTPGGFLETGWNSGKYVKYLWSYWEIKYVGFLIRRGGGLYSLQDGYYLPGHPPAGWVMPIDYVCPEFRTYL